MAEKRIASLPMRNWNSWRFAFQLSLIWIASLPMRNWNIYKFYSFIIFPIIASLPMRNWNIAEMLSPREKAEHCQPTYEELKLLNNYQKQINSQKIASLPMRNWNTWFGILDHLKNNIASLPMRNWNVACVDLWAKSDMSDCQPTYEELKQQNYISLSIRPQFIASLPMRNWNRESDLYRMFSKCHCQPTYEELKLRSCLQFSWPWPDCQPTYEELKHILEKEYQAFQNILPAYLWGIETSL